MNNHRIVTAAWLKASRQFGIGMYRYAGVEVDSGALNRSTDYLLNLTFILKCDFSIALDNCHYMNSITVSDFPKLSSKTLLMSNTESVPLRTTVQIVSGDSYEMLLTLPEPIQIVNNSAVSTLIDLLY